MLHQCYVMAWKGPVCYINMLRHGEEGASMLHQCYVMVRKGPVCYINMLRHGIQAASMLHQYVTSWHGSSHYVTSWRGRGHYVTSWRGRGSKLHHIEQGVSMLHEYGTARRGRGQYTAAWRSTRGPSRFLATLSPSPSGQYRVRLVLSRHAPSRPRLPRTAVWPGSTRTSLHN